MTSVQWSGLGGIWEYADFEFLPWLYDLSENKLNKAPLHVHSSWIIVSLSYLSLLLFTVELINVLLHYSRRFPFSRVGGVVGVSG